MWLDIFGEYRDLTEVFLKTLPLPIIGGFAGYATAQVKQLWASLTTAYETIETFRKRINELEFQISHLSNYLNQKRQESMSAAIKDATENPEKYVQGQFAIIKPGNEENPNGA